MNRRRWMWVGGGALVLIVVCTLMAKARAAQLYANVSNWTKAHQPPDGIAADAVEPVTPAWNGCATPSPMVASCEGYGAGRRVRKLYPDRLCNASSLIRVGANFEAGV